MLIDDFESEVAERRRLAEAMEAQRLRNEGIEEAYTEPPADEDLVELAPEPGPPRHHQPAPPVNGAPIDPQRLQWEIVLRQNAAQQLHALAELLSGNQTTLLVLQDLPRSELHDLWEEAKTGIAAAYNAYGKATFLLRPR